MLKGIHLSILIGPAVAVPAPQPVIEALRSVQVTTSDKGASGFQLTFALSKNSLLNQVMLPAGYFDPPNRVIIIVTVNGLPNVLMDGVITRQELAPSNEPGQSTLTITGEDLTRMMDLIDLSGIPYPAMPADARAALILARYAVLGIIPLVIPSIVLDIPNPLDEIPEHQGTDLQYLRQLADNVGYVFYIDPGPAPGINTAYWGPQIKIGLPQPALTINMDAHTNVETLSFSYDGFAKTLYIISIQEPASKVLIPIPIPDITPLNPPLGLKPQIPLRLERLNDTAKMSPLEAVAYGLAKASQSSDVISGSGSLDVLRYGRILKARQLVGVRGAGITYDGFYYVSSVTHDIKPGEYKQNFNLSRNGLISQTPSVPV
jgi:hypothetical protein